jgi:methionyl-tRNA formyltransferase
MRVLFAGTPEAAVPALAALLDSPHEVVAVLTRPDAPAGRGRRLTPSPVAQVALDAGIEVLRPPRAGDPQFLARLTALRPDAAPIVAYGGLIPRAALDVPPYGWINLHFSLLPAWRGAAPVQHAVMAGDELTGASTFVLEEGLDTGPVLGVVTDAIGATDTAGDVLDRLAHAGAGLLVASLDGLERGALVAVAQPGEGVSLAPKITVADAQIVWTDPAMRVDRVVRGCTPAPGAWSQFRGERVKFGPVRLDPDVTDLDAGELRVIKNRVWAGTATHAVLLGDLKAEGKKWMPAGDWSRGVRVLSGERLG